MKRKIETFAGLAPAIAIIICVSMALSGYTKPIYSIENVPKQPAAAKKALKTLAVNVPTKKAEKIGKAEDPGEYKDGTYVGSARGYNGLIKVKVTIEEGKISAIKVVSHNEDQPYFRNAEKRIIPAIIKGQSTNVDTVSGATFSSNGLIGAVRNALAKAAAAKDNKELPPDELDDENQDQQEIPEIPKPSEDESISAPENYVYKDGEYTNDNDMVLCEHPRDTSWAYYLSVKVTIKDGKIAEVKESKKVGKTGNYNAQNNSYLKRAFSGLGSRKGMEAKIVENQGTANVDAVTGATISSNAIIESVNLILPTIEKIPVEVPDDTEVTPEPEEKPETGEDSEEKEPENTENTETDKKDPIVKNDECIVQKNDIDDPEDGFDNDDLNNGSENGQEQSENEEIFN